MKSGALRVASTGLKLLSNSGILMKDSFSLKMTWNSGLLTMNLYLAISLMNWFSKKVFTSFEGAVLPRISNYS